MNVYENCDIWNTFVHGNNVYTSEKSWNISLPYVLNKAHPFFLKCKLINIYITDKAKFRCLMYLFMYTEHVWRKNTRIRVLMIFFLNKIFIFITVKCIGPGSVFNTGYTFFYSNNIKIPHNYTGQQITCYSP